ncbi:type II toxin-antitoxin system RelE/ParE family toxin [bacterium]|nr:type II toxin-antitoxin system RelE/ParE family toxin [bacterium]
MRIEWSESAVAALDAIVTYGNQLSAQYAARIGTRLVERVSILADHPFAGPMVPEYGVPAIRELSEAPYRILYRVGDTAVEILNIVHGSRLLRP